MEEKTSRNAAVLPKKRYDRRGGGISGGGWRWRGWRVSYSIYLRALWVCLWRSLGLTERSWGGAVFGCLDARWECCPSLFNVPRPFSLMQSLPSGLFALSTLQEGLDLQSTSPHLLGFVLGLSVFHPSFILFILPPSLHFKQLTPIFFINSSFCTSQ